MPIAKESQDFVPAPEGTHPARCISCISLGTQPSAMFMPSFKVMLAFELPEEKKEINGEQVPMVVTKEYTLSLSKRSNLRKDLDSWRGRSFSPEECQGFQVAKVVGNACLVNVVHKTSDSGKTYAQIVGVSKMPKGLECPAQYHNSVVYEIEDGVSDVYKKLPEWVQKKIKASEEWQYVSPPPVVSATTARDIVKKAVREAEQRDAAASAEPEPDNSDDVPF